MPPLRFLVILFVLGTLGYVLAARATFTVPVSLADAEACGFTSGDFSPAGELSYPPTRAWLVSFVRKEEYWTAASVGLAVALAGFALRALRTIGAGLASGAALGSGLLAIASLCVSCLAPTLSMIGLGMVASSLAGVPKWAVTLNTAIFTTWGALFLSRRMQACPIAPPRRDAFSNAREAVR